MPLPQDDQKRRLSEAETGKVVNSLTGLLSRLSVSPPSKKSDLNSSPTNAPSLAPKHKSNVVVVEGLGSPLKEANESVSKFSFASLNNLINSEKKSKKSENISREDMIDNNFSLNASEDIKNSKIIRERYKKEANECADGENFQQQKEAFMSSFNFIVKNVEQ